MKKSIILFVSILTLGLGFTSCSSSDSGSSSIVGKWEFYQQGTSVNGTEILQSYVHQSGCAKDNIEFFSDGTVTSTEYDSDCLSFVSDGDYTKDGNTLTTNYGEGDYSVTIKTLSSSTLKVYETEVFEGQTITNVTVLKRVD